MDLQVDGPYSPISLKKIIASGIINPSTEINVFIPGTNEVLGFAADDEETINIMIEDRVMQAHYFIEEIYPTLPKVPAYLFRYIHWMMFDYNKMKYATDADYIFAIENNDLELHSEEYEQVHNFIKWGKTNSEATHLIGLVQLIAGALKAAARQKCNVRLFIELIETGFHPKRERSLVVLLNKLKDEYGYKKP